MANWPYVKIGDVCTVERGGSPRPIDKFITDDPNGINWIKIGDTNDSMYITSTAQKIIPEGMKKSRYVQPGDFLLSNSMSFGRPYILKIDGCIHDGWLVLRDNKNTFDKRFLYYYLSSPSTYRKFENMAVGGVVNNLNSEMVRGVSVPVPPMNEQLEIVGILEQVTALISLRKQQIAKLDELVKARFVEMFGDPVSNPKGWEMAPLSSLAEIKIGPFGSLLHKEDYVSDEHPLVNPSHIVDGRIVVDNELTVNDAKYEEMVAYHLHPGDVVLGRRGEMGRCAVVYEQGMLCGTGSLIIRPSDMMHPYFLQKIISYPTFKKAIEDMAVGVTMMNLNVPIVSSFMIPVLPRDQQDAYLAFVAQTDKQKLTIQHSLAKLELLKKALMQKYFG